MARFLTLLLLFVFSAVGAQSYLKEDTAVTIMVGPIVDSADATAETGLTLSQADIRLSKNAGNMAQKNEATSCTHDELGKYTCPLNTTDTNTAGILTVTIGEAGTMVWSRDYFIVGTGEYDRLTGAVAQLTSTMVGLVASSTVETVTSQTEFVLVDGPSNDDALVTGSTILFVSATERCEATIADYTGSTTTLEVQAACPDMTVAIGDAVYAFAGPSGSSVATIDVNLSALSGDLATHDGKADTAQLDLDVLVDVAPSELMQPTTIATLASQVSFTLTDGSTDDDAYNGHSIVIVDASTSVQRAVGIVQDYVGSTKTVTLRFDPAIFTMAVGDLVYIRTEKK